MGVCICSMFCCTLLYFHSSFAIIFMGKRELVALLSLSSWCLVMVVWLFLAVPWVRLRFVILVFPYHTHILDKNLGLKPHLIAVYAYLKGKQGASVPLSPNLCGHRVTNTELGVVWYRSLVLIAFLLLFWYSYQIVSVYGSYRTSFYFLERFALCTKTNATLRGQFSVTKFQLTNS